MTDRMRDVDERPSARHELEIRDLKRRVVELERRMDAVMEALSLVTDVLEPTRRTLFRPTDDVAGLDARVSRLEP